MSHKGLYICPECSKVWRAMSDAIACHNMQPKFLPSKVDAINLNKDEDILKCVAKQGWFSVSLRYRDEWLVNKCLRMCKKGLMVKQRKISMGIIYLHYQTTSKMARNKNHSRILLIT